MKNLYFIMGAIILGFFIKSLWDRPNIKEIQLAGIHTANDVAPEQQKVPLDNCLSNTYCIFVYVAPWCPYCHSFLNELEIVKNKLKSKSIGIVIVVGADKERTKEIALKEKHSKDAVLDSVDHKFRKENKVEYFPYFIVARSDRQVRYAGKPAIDFMNSSMAKP